MTPAKKNTRVPCPIPTDPEQKLDIVCSHCGTPIDFRKGEVYDNLRGSYVCRKHTESDEDVIQYAMRRLDTGEFYWTPKISYLHKPPHGDPRWSNWTKDMNKAKLYSWRGIVSLSGHHKKDYHNQPLPYKVEILKVKLVVEQIIPVLCD